MEEKTEAIIAVRFDRETKLLQSSDSAVYENLPASVLHKVMIGDNLQTFLKSFGNYVEGESTTFEELDSLVHDLTEQTRRFDAKLCSDFLNAQKELASDIPPL
jgi:hypothetical protein